MDITYKNEILKKSKDGSMKTIQMASGQLVIPPDFKILDLGIPMEECSYAGVIANRKCEELGIPHFVFGHNHQVIPCGFSDYVYSKLSEVYPRYDELRAMEVIEDPITEEDYDKYWASPEFGIFKIPNENDSHDRLNYLPGYKAPYDAVLIMAE